MANKQDYCNLDEKLISDFKEKIKSKLRDKNLVFELFYKSCIHNLEETEEQLKNILKPKKKIG